MRSKIVHIAKATGIHGMEKHLLGLLPALTTDYETIFIILTEPGKPVDAYCDELRTRGVRVYTLPIRFDIDPACFIKIYSLLQKLKPGLVHTHLIHGDLYGILAARLAGMRPIVSTKHNDDEFRRNRIVRRLNIFLNKRVSHIITISNWIRQFVTEVEHVPPEKSTTVYYGLDTSEPVSGSISVRSEWGFSRQDLVFGITARLVEQKGHRYLIEAFAEACTSRDDIRLLIVGEGPLMASLQRLVQDKNLSRVVQFAGFRTDIDNVLRNLDVFIHPSLWEGFGLAVLEAMAMGKPIIATKVSALPELIEDGINGCLVPPRDSSSLARAIIRLSSDETLRRSLGQNARRKCQKVFSAERMVKATRAVYAELLYSC